VPWLTAWGFSASVRCTGGCTHPDEKSTELAMDLTGCQQAIRSGTLPGQSKIGHQAAGEPQLPAGGSDQPRPASGGGRVAWPHRGPAERLLEETEGVLEPPAVLPRKH
jgi:hypothetical protein